MAQTERAQSMTGYPQKLKKKKSPISLSFPDKQKGIQVASKITPLPYLHH